MSIRLEIVNPLIREEQKSPKIPEDVMDADQAERLAEIRRIIEEWPCWTSADTGDTYYILHIFNKLADYKANYTDHHSSVLRDGVITRIGQLEKGGEAAIRLAYSKYCRVGNRNKERKLLMPTTRIITRTQIMEICAQRGRRKPNLPLILAVLAQQPVRLEDKPVQVLYYSIVRAVLRDMVKRLDLHVTLQEEVSVWDRDPHTNRLVRARIDIALEKSATGEKFALEVIERKHAPEIVERTRMLNSRGYHVVELRERYIGRNPKRAQSAIDAMLEELLVAPEAESLDTSDDDEEEEDDEE
jgi:hypothetical protein